MHMSKMAETVVLGPVIEGALFKMASFPARQIRLPGGVDKELSKLRESLIVIQSVLQDAEEKQENDPVIRIWLLMLKDIAYDAVDVLDKVAYKVLQLKVETQSQVRRVRTLFSLSYTIAFRMADKIKKINESLLTLRRDEVFPSLTRNKSPQVGQQAPATDSYIEKTVIGRDKDVSEIKYCLLDQRHGDSRHPISVISLIGMAGVGKTAIAKLLLQQARMELTFDVVAWVCVSNDFDERKILEGILEHLDQNVGGIYNMNVLLRVLQEKLAGKNFLLVLDDVWNEDSNSWATFRGFLLKIVRASYNCILVTTRNEGVASCIAKFFPLHKHHVEKLSVDDCWSIIETEVARLHGVATPLDKNLEAIGRDIAKRCGGLPLIANVLGEKISATEGEYGWLSIKDRIEWNLEDDDQILRIIKLSYDHLPSRLKKCFSYCSIFPADFVIEKDDLVQIWMSQGFLLPSSQEMMEDIGNKYINDLLSNSLMEIVERDRFGNIKSCKMHDVLHDLAVFVSRSETLTLKNGSIHENSSIQHLRVLSGAEVDPTFLRDVAAKLHSLFTKVDFCLMDLKRIRTLSLVEADVDKLPTSLGKLKHLGYFDISKTKVKALPKSFTKLYTLQTFKFESCQSLEKLPSRMKNLISLRHIYFDNPRLMPQMIGHLTSLQTLPLFVVGRERGYWIEELGHLSQLGGVLKICNLEFVTSRSEATKAKLQEKTKLYKLQFEWRENKEGSSNHEEILEGLQPHSNLKILVMDGYMGEKFPSWMEKGVNLLELILVNCHECRDIPSLGLLPSLQVLEINHIKRVKHMGSKFYHNKPSLASSSHNGQESITLFPALKILKIKFMGDLEEWAEMEDVDVFPCLEELYIGYCPVLKTWSMSGFSSVQLSMLKIDSCPNLVAVPNIFLSWRMEKRADFGDSALNNLLELKLYNCDAVMDFLSLGSLPHLQVLEIKKMAKVKLMGSKFYLSRSSMTSSCHGGGKSVILFPSLNKLTIEFMGSLEEWVEVEDLPVFPCLERLYIGYCPVLKTWSMGEFSSHHNLPMVKIESCPNLVVVPNMDKLLSLGKIDISNCKNLIYPPSEQNRPAQSKIDIREDP